MKHLSHRFLLVAGLAMLLVSMVSCKKDSDANNSGNSDSQAATATIKIGGSISEGLSDCCVLKAVYNIEDNGGNESQDGVLVSNTLEFKEDCPCTVNLYFFYSTNPTKIDTTATYNGKLQNFIKISTSTGDTYNKDTHLDVTDVPGSQLRETIKIHSDSQPHYVVSIDAKGTITSAKLVY